MKQSIYTAYAETNDITFIMREESDDQGNVTSTEVVGWYYGEENEENTSYFTGKLKAEY